MIFLTMPLIPKKSPVPEIELPEPEEDTEVKRIMRWRKRQLVHAGYSMQLASMLAVSLYVDTHQAGRMLASGCDEELAAKILL